MIIIILLLTIIFLYYIAFDKNTYGIKSFISLLIIMPLLILISCSIYLFYLLNNNIPVSILKDISAPLISIIGLIITSSIAYITIIFNKNKAEIDLVMSMIKFQNELIDEKTQESAENLLLRLHEELHDSNLMFIRILNQVKNLIKDMTTLEDLKDREIELQLLKLIENNKKDFKEKWKINYNNISDKYKNKLSGKSIVVREDFRILVENDIYKKFYSNHIAINEKNLKYDEVAPIINDAFELHYPELGHFFKHFYRIIRLLIQGHFKKNEKLRKEMTGILRAQFSEDFLLILYYNAVYTYRGYGLGNILQGLSFFGDTSDFTTNPQIDLQHISNKSLIFGTKDKNIMRLIFSERNIVPVNNKEKLSNFIIEVKKIFDNHDH
ncbi:putative phage abortive infection protein [Macrococcoides canis]|uniref:putative phage abortive infection protein n=1 Tax=Macrococcoides canis TaxID=1855823 RepID=UPI0010FC0D1D|nr:putative phage abortive infection protein [Macrococcus canis]QCT74153.1 hypothetical protein EST43_02415 [Macrococcus canis]